MDIFVFWNMFFNNNEEDNEHDWLIQIEREQHIKINNYFENIVLAYSVTDFKSHFNIPSAKQCAIALWIFGNEEVYRSVADRFGVCKDTVWKCVFNVAYALEQQVHNYIKWPQVHELLHIQQEFAAMNGFPGVVGVIDGCHIRISAPTEHPNSYINRKGFHSILLQGICDHDMKFIDIYTGICGSVHDARVWRLSDIKQFMEQDVHRYFPQHGHLLADSAYPLTYNMLIPYRDNGHLNDRQRNYNTKLSTTRVTIERAFGMLKGRFRKLRYVYMYNTDMIPLVVLACCVLHNICIDNEDELFDNILEPLEDGLIDDNDNHNYAVIQADEKRDIIAQLLYNL